MLQSHVTSLHVNLLFPITNKTNTSEKCAKSTSSKFRSKKTQDLFCFDQKNINSFYFILTIPKCHFLLKSLKTRNKVIKFSFLKFQIILYQRVPKYALLHVSCYNTWSHTTKITWL